MLYLVLSRISHISSQIRILHFDQNRRPFYRNPTENMGMFHACHGAWPARHRAGPTSTPGVEGRSPGAADDAPSCPGGAMADVSQPPFLGVTAHTHTRGCLYIYI